MDAAYLIVLALSGFAFAGLGIAISGWVSPQSKNPQKFDPYECGVPTVGSTWIQFNVGYYLFALVFLVFDVEIVFLYPWSVVLREMGTVAFVEIFVFVFILFLGLLYAWKKRALKWV